MTLWHLLQPLLSAPLSRIPLDPGLQLLPPLSLLPTSPPDARPRMRIPGTTLIVQDHLEDAVLCGWSLRPAVTPQQENNHLYRLRPEGSRAPNAQPANGRAHVPMRCNRLRGQVLEQASHPWAPAPLCVQFSHRTARLPTRANHRLMCSPLRPHTLLIPHYKQEIPSKGPGGSLPAIGSKYQACREGMSLQPRRLRCCVNRRGHPLQRPGRTRGQANLRDDYLPDEKHKDCPCQCRHHEHWGVLRWLLVSVSQRGRGLHNPR